ncbi:MAG: hypothetical protein Q9224_004655 [Gallowayella concinna]
MAGIRKKNQPGRRKARAKLRELRTTVLAKDHGTRSRVKSGQNPRNIWEQASAIWHNRDPNDCPLLGKLPTETLIEIMDYVFPPGETLTVKTPFWGWNGSRKIHFAITRVALEEYPDEEDGSPGGSAWVDDAPYDHHANTEVWYTCHQFHELGRRSYYRNNTFWLSSVQAINCLNCMSPNIRQYLRNLEIVWGYEPNKTFKTVAKLPQLRDLKITIYLCYFPRNCDPSSAEKFLRAFGASSLSKCRAVNVTVEVNNYFCGDKRLPESAELEKEVKRLLKCA